MSPLTPRPVASEQRLLPIASTGRPGLRTSRLARHAARVAGGASILAALLGAALPAQAAFTVTRTSDSYFYISASAAANNIRNMYVAYRITNTGPGAQSDVWVKLDTFTGGIVSLATNEDGLYHIGPLNAGQSAMAYPYLTASATTNTPQTHTVRVYDRRPDLAGAVQLVGSLQTLLAVRSSIASSSSKVDVLVTGPSPAALGGIVTVTVSGRTGNVGAGDILVFTAAS